MAVYVVMATFACAHLVSLATDVVSKVSNFNTLSIRDTVKTILMHSSNVFVYKQAAYCIIHYLFNYTSYVRTSL